MQTAMLLIFTLAWSAGVLFFDGFFARGFFKQFESRYYPTVAGTVTHSELKSHRGSKGGVSYEAIIEYRFEAAAKAPVEAGGKEVFTGSRLRYNSGDSDYASAARIVAAHPQGSPVQVFYNPADPRDSVLFPGVQGVDFLMVLFLTPFNAIMLGFWVAIGGRLRERLVRPVAGGVKIIADGMSTRVRLPQFGALGWGLVTAGGLGFVSMFVVGIPTKMQPSIGLALTAIALVYLAGAGVYVWQWRKINSGADDLVINPAARTLDLPQTFDRKQRVTAGFADIESLMVDKIIHTSSKGGVSYTYAPTLRLRGTEPGEQKLADWSDKERADDFAEWLRQQLGL